MNYKEAIQAIRQLDPDIRAIVSSGYSHEDLLANFKEYGFDGILSKPYSVVEMTLVIDSVLNNR